jgi:predicted DNA binding CopG/RHH family protein
MKRTNKIPKFKNIAEERAFWKKTDSTDLVDWSRASDVIMPDLKPTVRSISIRLTESMIEELKVIANKRDIPYQSLMKVFLSERIEEELTRFEA